MSGLVFVRLAANANSSFREDGGKPCVSVTKTRAIYRTCPTSTQTRCDCRRKCNATKANVWTPERARFSMRTQEVGNGLRHNEEEADASDIDRSCTRVQSASVWPYPATIGVTVHSDSMRLDRDEGSHHNLQSHWLGFRLQTIRPLSTPVGLLKRFENLQNSPLRS